MTQAARKQREIIDTQKKDNEAWYNRNYYEDSTQRSDAQRAMQMARDAMKSRYNQAQASGVVSSAASSIAATGDSRKDSIDQQYLNTKANLAQQEAETWKQQGAAIAQAAQGVGNAGSKMFDL